MKWIKVEDELPKSNLHVYIKTLTGNFAGWYCENGKSWECHDTLYLGGIEGVTHWAKIEQPE